MIYVENIKFATQIIPALAVSVNTGEFAALATSAVSFVYILLPIRCLFETIAWDTLRTASLCPAPLIFSRTVSIHQV
ncbi:MAG TPA: hypothetical protein VIF60_16385 [Burkholderiaceae bacterium]